MLRANALLFLSLLAVVAITVNTHNTEATAKISSFASDVKANGWHCGHQHGHGPAHIPGHAYGHRPHQNHGRHCPPPRHGNVIVSVPAYPFNTCLQYARPGAYLEIDGRWTCYGITHGRRAQFQRVCTSPMEFSWSGDALGAASCRPVGT